MKTKFTKGKWNIEDKSSNGILPKEDAFSIVENTFVWDICAVWKDCEDITTAKANALLISKAPEMFQMLVKVRQAILSEDYTRMLCESQSIKELLKEVTEI